MSSRLAPRTAARSSSRSWSVSSKSTSCCSRVVMRAWSCSVSLGPPMPDSRQTCSPRTVLRRASRRPAFAHACLAGAEGDQVGSKSEAQKVFSGEPPLGEFDARAHGLLGVENPVAGEMEYVRSDSARPQSAQESVASGSRAVQNLRLLEPGRHRVRVSAGEEERPFTRRPGHDHRRRPVPGSPGSAVLKHRGTGGDRDGIPADQGFALAWQGGQRQQMQSAVRDQIHVILGTRPLGQRCDQVGEPRFSQQTHERLTGETRRALTCPPGRVLHFLASKGPSWRPPAKRHPPSPRRSGFVPR